VAADLKVLLVEGKRGLKLEDSAGGLLAQALSTPGAIEPGKPQHNDGVASTELITDFELGNQVLTDYAAVILTDVATVTPQEADALANFVKKGGTLMLFMGDAVDRQNYNTVLGPRKLLPGQLVKNMLATNDSKPFFFDFKPKGVLHPYLGIFANQEKTGLDTAPIEVTSKRISIQSSASSACSTICPPTTRRPPTRRSPFTRLSRDALSFIPRPPTATGPNPSRPSPPISSSCQSWLAAA